MADGLENYEEIFVKTVQLWSEGETQMLLDKYSLYLPEIGPMKKFKTKKDMWSQIANDVKGKSAKQCEERFKTVLKRKKSSMTNSTSSGAKRQKIEFEDELNKIALLDDSVEPEVKISSNQIVIKPTQTPKKERLKPKSIEETLLEIAQRKKEGKQQRHAERLQCMQKMHDLLEQVFQKKDG